jgi:uncharacterized surface protein with fasciclin (FAS1) repeats
MKKHINNTAIFVLLVFLTMTSCAVDVWENHYNTKALNKSSLTLTQYIESQDSLKIFSKMLKIAGYDTILNSPQTYTVWAPTDNALKNIDLSDSLTVKNTVMNHITRFLRSTSGLNTMTMHLLSNKYISFKKDAGGYSYGNQMLVGSKSDVATKNGILHVIDGYVPYKLNVWELINSKSNNEALKFDSISAFLNTMSKYDFDEKNSIEIGTNKFGQSVYDSVKIFSNPVLNSIGALNKEDSIYTAIIPNNKAWKKAYDLVYSKYKSFGLDGSATQRSRTQTALVNNLIFRLPITDPSMYDSLTTTTGSKFKNPGYLFEGATRYDLSNGYAYITDSIRFKAADTYQKKILIEAEDITYNRTSAYASLTMKSALGTDFSEQVSEKYYMQVDPTTTSATSTSVSFPIPNTLSGTYNIYCVFVPSSIVVAGSKSVNKAKFYLSYLNVNGTQTTDAAVTVKNELSSTKSNAFAFSSIAGAVTKVFVTKFTFPYCNLFTTGTSPSLITTKLRVENAVKITDSKDLFDKSMRIDCIILEPVQ